MDVGLSFPGGAGDSPAFEVTRIAGESPAPPGSVLSHVVRGARP